MRLDAHFDCSFPTSSRKTSSRSYVLRPKCFTFRLRSSRINRRSRSSAAASLVTLTCQQVRPSSGAILTFCTQGWQATRPRASVMEASALALERDGIDGRATIACQQLGNGRLGDQRTPVQDRHRITHPLHVFEDVRGVEDGGVFAQLLHDLQHIVPAHRVERRGRLVQNQQIRIVDLGLGDTQALSLTAREAAQRPVGLVVQAHQLEHFLHPRVDEVFRPAIEEVRCVDEVSGGRSCARSSAEPGPGSRHACGSPGSRVAHHAQRR